MSIVYTHTHTHINRITSSANYLCLLTYCPRCPQGRPLRLVPRAWKWAQVCYVSSRAQPPELSPMLSRLWVSRSSGSG